MQGALDSKQWPTKYQKWSHGERSILYIHLCKGERQLPQCTKAFLHVELSCAHHAFHACQHRTYLQLICKLNLVQCSQELCIGKSLWQTKTNTTIFCTWEKKASGFNLTNLYVNQRTKNCTGSKHVEITTLKIHSTQFLIIYTLAVQMNIHNQFQNKTTSHVYNYPKCIHIETLWGHITLVCHGQFQKMHALNPLCLIFQRTGSSAGDSKIQPEILAVYKFGGLAPN